MEGQEKEQAIVVISEQSDFRSWRKGLGFGLRRQPVILIICGATAAFWLWQVIWLARDAYSGDENGAGLIPFLFITTLIFLFLFVVIPRGIYRSNASVTTTWFYENRFSFYSVRRDITLSDTRGYDQVSKAYETKDTFYLKHKKGWCFLPKSRLTEEQIKALRELFARKFGEKFKSKV